MEILSARSFQATLFSLFALFFLVSCTRFSTQKERPLLLALHGAGQTGEDEIRILQKEADKRGVILLAPTRTKGYRDEPSELEEFYQWVEETARRQPIDRKRIFLTGTSSGALIARWLAVNRPSFWRGIILIASPTAESWTSQLKPAGFPPVLFVHGEKDEQFPISEIRRHVEILREKGVDVELLSDPKEGHTQSPRWNKALFDWIEKKSA